MDLGACGGLVETNAFTASPRSPKTWRFSIVTIGYCSWLYFGWRLACCIHFVQELQTMWQLVMHCRAGAWWETYHYTGVKLFKMNTSLIVSHRWEEEARGDDLSNPNPEFSDFKNRLDTSVIWQIYVIWRISFFYLLDWTSESRENLILVWRCRVMMIIAALSTSDNSLHQLYLVYGYWSLHKYIFIRKSCTSCVALLYRGWHRKWLKVPRRASRHFQRLTSST